MELTLAKIIDFYAHNLKILVPVLAKYLNVEQNNKKKLVNKYLVSQFSLKSCYKLVK